MNNYKKGSLKRRRVIPKASMVNDFVKVSRDYCVERVVYGNGQKYRSLDDWKRQTNHWNDAVLSKFMFIDVKETRIEITSRYAPESFRNVKDLYQNGKACTYCFNLNDEPINWLNGQSCFVERQKSYKIPDAKEYNLVQLDDYFDDYKGTYRCSASPLVGYRGDGSKQILENCYEYDLNSAYSTQLKKGIPDLNNPCYCDGNPVPKGFIGFLIDDQLTMVHEGMPCDIAFPRIKTPAKLNEFIDKYYNLKKTSTGNEKRKAKARLNLPIGYSQRKNPFFRAYVVHSCNEAIKAVMDEDTVSWNTDAIFSKKRRPDLELGIEIGQWKEVPINRFVYVGLTYQIDDNLPVWRGIAKAWLRHFEKVNGRPFDLAKDKLTERINKYYFDGTTRRLKKNEN